MKFVATVVPVLALIAAGCSDDAGGEDTAANDGTGSMSSMDSTSSTGCYDPTGTTGAGTGINQCGGDGADDGGEDDSGPDEGDDAPAGCVMGGMLPDAVFEGTVSGDHSGVYTLDLPMGTTSPSGEATNGSSNSTIGLFLMQALGPGSAWQFTLPSQELTEVVPGTYGMNTGRLDVGGFALPTTPDGWGSTGGSIEITDVVPHCDGAPGVYIDGSFSFDAANNRTGTTISATGTFSGIFIVVG